MESWVEGGLRENFWEKIFDRRALAVVGGLGSGMVSGGKRGKF